MMSTPPLMDFTIDAASRLPIYRQLSQALARWLRASQLQPGAMLPGLGQLAAECKVSTRTMDKAVQQLIQDGILYRRPKKGTFVGEGKASSPAAVSKDVVLLYVPDFGMEYFNTDQADRRLYNGMRQAAKLNGVDILLANHDPEYYLINPYPRVRGVLCLESSPLAEIALLASRHPTIPFVYANYCFQGFEEAPDNVYGVFNDDAAGAFEMADFFFERGWKAPLVMTMNSGNRNYLNRVRGFQLAAEQHGVSISQERQCDIPNCHDWWEHRRIAARLLREVFARGQTVDVIFTVADFIAEAIAREVQHHSFPRETVLCGYDGYFFQGKMLPCPTMCIDFEEIGRQAFDVAMGGCPARHREIRILPTLVNVTRFANAPVLKTEWPELTPAAAPGTLDDAP